MHKKKLLTIIASLIVMAILVTACAPETVIETVVVEKEVPGEPVEGE
ncbi:MAG: hypothetical protein IIC79_04985, partial [Chloroflexi bacterium]|nr:hypothetical protein [Chloroflexota bacterium]